MIDVNWNLAPEGAIGVAQRGKQLAFIDNGSNIFLDDHWGISMGWELVAKRPTFAESITKKPQPEKTVAAAVEWADGKWVGGDSRFIVFHKGLDKFAFVVTSAPYENGWELVCTRAEFEAYVKEQDDFVAKAQGDFVSNEEQESEKWTHVTSIGKCRILVDKPDEHGYIVVEMESDGYSLIPLRGLKPIKPTMSKSEAWDYAVASGLCAEEIESKYDIT